MSSSRLALWLGALAVTGAAVVGFAAPGPPAQARAGRTLDWVAVKKADTEPRTVTLGASWVTYLELHEARNGKPGRMIGDGSARCGAVLVTKEGPVTQCQRVLRLHDGSLALSAMIDRFGSGPYTGSSAVVGGTGIYATAAGDAEITLDGDLVRFRIHLDG
ncbi:hypothetical protein [Streptomyces sp. NPDC051569]|uniref:hypothetical protein n=1 Tax=Streptomyces sp. NPDC051569 TaxID=3365661 RepID=UPI0037941B92